ncbi:MAG: DNA gyrase subunit A [Candidatus Woesearchaeota archaeon]
MPEEIQEKLIEEEMKQAYMDYAMSVIISRALPDVRDGLKPVHRRILYAMLKEGLLSNKKYSKCAGVVGEVLKRYHPHGDSSVYDALVRMAQDWNLRYPLIDGHGNFGNIDGDRAAAYRYTESRLKKIAEEVLVDIEKDTVDLVDNFDGSVKEPVVLPSRIPNLLINGSSGIAVGMATNVPPHNIKEVCEAIIHFVDDKECSVMDLMKFVRGPDFPTGGIILGESGIRSAYMHGKGRLVVRAKTKIEDSKIIVNEIPYMVNKGLLIESIADLVRDKRVDGVHDIRDESDRKGMRIVIELKRGANAEVILNQLYKLSNLQTTFGANMLSLVNQEPRVLNLKDMVGEFVKHRFDVVTRRTKFDLDKSEKRSHVLEGLRIALTDIDPVVKGIKESENVEKARLFLIENFKLSEIQANAILEMRLQKLTSLETKKIEEEYNSLLKLIEELKSILADENKVYGIIKQDTKEVMETYGDERKTEISEANEEVIMDEDLINEEDVVVIVTQSGYVKQVPLDMYRSQLRGGTGVRTATVKEEDVIDQVFVTSNLSNLLFFTNKGKVHWLKAYLIPEAGRYARGTNLVNLLRLGKDESLSAVLSIKSFDENLNLMFGTKKGIVKKTSLSEFDNPRRGGILAIKLREGDEVVAVKLCSGGMRFIVGSRNGRAVRFREGDVREMGRTAAGVRGIKLISDRVVGMEVALDDSDLLTVTENGYGKRTKMDEYRLISRGGKGVRNIKITEKTGRVVGIKAVRDSDEAMCVSDKGQIIRMEVKGISRIGRNTQGVRVIRLREGDRVAHVSKVVKSVE